MKCSKCQSENPEKVKFCVECGSKLKVICSSCGYENSPSYKFCGECGHDLRKPEEFPPKNLFFHEKLAKIQKYLPKGLTEKILSQKDRIEGERKQVTVMFCDMKGYTSLSETLGPEKTYTLMDQVYEILIHKVHDYEGTVNELTGDGIMALFGAPIALEDAPQRAIRSAYAIHKEITKFSERIRREEENIPPIRMRIGIHTGPVVVGTLGNDLRVEFKAVGDTVNLASRVEGLSEPGATFVTEETFKLTEGFFRFEALGEKEVKGKASPVKVFRVIAPSSLRARFDVSAERGLTPFIGRERELELLLDGFGRTKEGRGQAFSIMAEAGLGKSRLLYEFRKAVSNENITFLEGKCLSYSRSVAYHPVIDVIKSNFLIEEADGDAEIIEKVKAGLKAIEANEASTLPYLLELLSVKDSGIDKIPMSPEAKKDRIIGAVKRITLKGSEKRPLVIAIEDLHWSDNSSQEYLKSLLNSIAGARVFLIFTYRPEFFHTWGGKSYQNHLSLNRLSNREIVSIATYLLGTDVVDSSIEELIIEKTEGVPFFIEEFVKSLIDLKIIVMKDRQWYLAKAVQELSIPSTVQDLIMAKIDLLPERAKEALQMGSAIGREFGNELIKRTTAFSEKDLMSYLSALKDSELIYERGVFPNSVYVFKHALVQDVVYQALLKSTRQRYHRKIAQVLEEGFPETVEANPELLGHHFTEAGLIEPAINYLQRAGEKAIKRSGNVEAISYFTKGLELLKTLPDTPERSRKELMLHNDLTPALIVTKGYAASDIQSNYDRAKELCQQIGDTQQLFSVLMGSYIFYVARADYQKAFELADNLLTLAHRLQDPPFFVGAHRTLAGTFFWCGEFDPAVKHCAQAIAYYDPKQDDHFVTYLLGAHQKQHCLLYWALILQWLGYPDQATMKSHEALSFAEKTEHPFTIAAALFFTAWLHYSRHEVDETIERADAAMNHSSKHGFPFFRALGTILLGWALAKKGRTEEGIAKIRTGLASFRDTGAEQWLPGALSLLAEAYCKAGKVREGLHLLEEAKELVDKTEERCWLPEIYRLMGEFLFSLSTSNNLEAEKNFRQAIDVARRLHAKSMELRAAVSLSRLWCHQGKRTSACELLTKIYGWFSEGFDTSDLKEAKAFLEKIK